MRFTNLILLLTIVFLFPSCCTKKGCPGDELPFIKLKFRNLPTLMNEAPMLYEVLNGTYLDSTQLLVSASNPSYVYAPFKDTNDEQAKLKLFVIRYKNKLDTIKNVTCDFFKETITCNKCFPVGNDRQTILRVKNFSYMSKGLTYLSSDTLYLN